MRALTWVIGAGLLAGSAVTGKAATLYLQNFGVPAGTTSEQPFSVDGWQLHAGSQAITPPLVSPGLNRPAGAISTPNGDVAPSGVQTNATTSGPVDSRTWYYAGQYSYYLGNAMCWTTDISIDLSRTNLSTITWYHRDTYDRTWGNGNNKGGDERVAMRIGGQWYLAPNTDVVATSGTGANNQWWLDTFTFTSANWMPLTFSPGSTLDMSITSGTSGTTTLPVGTVTAFGLYQIVPNGNLSRFDTFAINGTVVPLPSSVGLAVFGMALFAAGRRYRRVTSSRNR